ncbi:MAG: hypothetical protein ISS02_02670 [Candidatus Portnoybacteria bacterium]|nr:hypothetical protein [Candidatus Portnoybacteria bacterium]
MKNILIVLGIVVLLAGGAWYYFQQEEDVLVDEIVKSINIDLIQGKWTSLDDEKSVIEFKGDIKIDSYDNNKMNEGSFEFKQDNQRLIVTDVYGEIFEYSVVELTDNILTLTYLPRGNILKYQR